MAWLVHDGTVLASVERADSVKSRTKGLLGRDEIDGALLLRGTKSVHTIGMRFPIDVAFCDDEMRVLRIVTMPCLLYTSPSPRDRTRSRMPSSA